MEGEYRPGFFKQWRVPSRRRDGRLSDCGPTSAPGAGQRGKLFVYNKVVTSLVPVAPTIFSTTYGIFLGFAQDMPCEATPLGGQFLDLPVEMFPRPGRFDHLRHRSIRLGGLENPQPVAFQAAILELGIGK